MIYLHTLHALCLEYISHIPVVRVPSHVTLPTFPDLRSLFPITFDCCYLFCYSLLRCCDYVSISLILPAHLRCYVDVVPFQTLDPDVTLTISLTGDSLFVTTLHLPPYHTHLPHYHLFLTTHHTYIYVTFTILPLLRWAVHVTFDCCYPLFHYVHVGGLFPLLYMRAFTTLRWLPDCWWLIWCLSIR